MGRSSGREEGGSGLLRDGSRRPPHGLGGRTHGVLGPPTDPRGRGRPP